MTPLIVLALAIAGVFAGAVTTIAGLGGGILLIAGLSLFWPPATVLAATTPALFVGNFTRAALLRDAIDWRVTARFALAGIPAAFAASLAATAMPADWGRLAIAGLLFVFIARELRPGALSQVREPGSPWLATAAGALAGTISGLTGGAGFVATPLLDRLGLRPVALVATGSATMALVHLVKAVGFSAGEVLTLAALPAAAALAVGVVAGNAVGAKVLRALRPETFRRIMLAALGLAATWLFVQAVAF